MSVCRLWKYVIPDPQFRHKKIRTKIMNPRSSISTCEDILIEILSRLPAKSLVRFMSVCRLWKSIITGPQFRLLSNRPTRLLVHTNRECYTVEEEKTAAEVVFETDFPLRHLSFETAVIIGSDNGLICIDIYPPPTYNGVNCSYIIWNPCIRKHVVIPDHPEGNYTVYSNGFGAIKSGLDYKLVNMVGYTVTIDEDGGTEQKGFHVYSLKAGTWRRFLLDYDFYLDKEFSWSSAFLKGRLHWVVTNTSFFGYPNYISTFDLEDEVFENDAMMLPEHLSTTASFFMQQNVTVIKESLGVIVVQLQRDCTLWVMQEYGDVGSWVKLFSIDQIIWNSQSVHPQMVGVLKNGDLLLGLVGLWRTPELVTCDPKTKNTNNFGGGVLSPSEVCGFTNNYKESLVLLADDDRAIRDPKV